MCENLNKGLLFGLQAAVLGGGNLMSGKRIGSGSRRSILIAVSGRCSGAGSLQGSFGGGKRLGCCSGCGLRVAQLPALSLQAGDLPGKLGGTRRQPP